MFVRVGVVCFEPYPIHYRYGVSDTICFVIGYGGIDTNHNITTLSNFSVQFLLYMEGKNILEICMKTIDLCNNIIIISYIKFSLIYKVIASGKDLI